MVIDGHCHILPPSFPERRAELVARDATLAALFPDSKIHFPNRGRRTSRGRMATAESLIEEMDRARVTHAVVMGMGWTDPAVAKESNDYLLESVARYPSHLTGFCSVSPAWGDTAVLEVERCRAAGLRGIGELHPDTQGFDLTDKSVLAPLMGLARQLGLPVLIHGSEPVGHQYPGKGHTTPDRLYRFIENFPNNVIICAHWGGGLPFYALMPEVPEVIKNVYFDTAASPFLYRPDVIATVANLVGANKIIFGTDYPLIRHRRLMEQVRGSGLESGKQEAILGGNAARLLGI